MTAKAPSLETEYMKLIFWGDSVIPNIADNSNGASTAPLSNLWVSLHTAQPTSDAQTGNEAAYTGYTRESVARSSNSWAITPGTSFGSGASVSPLATIAFPIASTATSAETESYFAVGASSAGTGQIFYSGSISPSIFVAGGVTPRLTTGTVIQES
jgi:hypothetical protein